MDRLVFVVRRERAKLHDSLQHALVDERGVDVVLDRRLGIRRQRDSSPEQERRRWDRRTRPFADTEVAVRGWTIIRCPNWR
jgi:hypothetical protein